MEQVKILTEKELNKQAKYEKGESNKKSRLGETKFQNCGEVAFIVEYNNSTDVTVQFYKTGELVKCTYGQFMKGNIKSHFSPNTYGVGITGLESVCDENGKTIDSYICWHNMLMRCYSIKYQQKNNSYLECEVVSEWFYYSNFKIWYNENFYKVKNKKMCLDKDWLIKGNKIYSPDRCIFVPHSINSLIIKNNGTRGNYPVGVCFNINYGKYMASCSVRNEDTGKKHIKCLGFFNTSEEAFEVYKAFKESYIKEIAEKYKNQIPVKLYNAMINYQVEIDD